MLFNDNAKQFVTPFLPKTKNNHFKTLNFLISAAENFTVTPKPFSKAVSVISGCSESSKYLERAALISLVKSTPGIRRKAPIFRLR